MEAPRITMYYRLLSNIDETPITSWAMVPSLKELNLNFGNINATTGGESPNIIEFDIWNNEPAFSAGMLAEINKDAINCKFEVWDNEHKKSYSNLRPNINLGPEKSFVYARCISNDPTAEFKPISGATSLPSSSIFGNISTKAGTLSGQTGGDHTIIQTKIIFPSKNPSSDIVAKNFNFVFNFEYDFE